MELEKLVKIAGALSRSPLEGISIASVSRESKINAASLNRILRKMDERNEALKEAKGNDVFFRLNLKNSFARKYAEMASIKKRERFFFKKPEYRDLLANMKNAAADFSFVVGIFGSLARLEKKPKDIDVFIIYKIGDDIAGIDAAIRKQDARFAPVYMSEKEIKKKAGEKTMSAILQDLVILYGESDFWNMLAEAA